MTRQEEISNAVDTIIPISPLWDGRTYEQALMATGFEAGVKWADSHPKSPWISVKDDLPCNHEELLNPDDKRDTSCVFAIIHGHIVLSRMYKLYGKWHWESNEPSHWMPIPGLPKE